MQTTDLAWPPSLWAAVTPPGPALPVVAGDAEADVAVVGGGFTGLSTALHLARSGIDVALIEAAEPGWGASGRNNGQVIPCLTRAEPDDIERRHGAAGERLVALIRDSASILFDVVGAEGIDAEAEQTGWIQPVHTPGRMKIAEKRVKQWSKRGAPAELIDAARMRDLLGSGAWHGGWGNRTGGHINPLALARGLTGAVVKRGGRVFARSPVTEMTHQGDRWRLACPGGTVTARAVVLATNAYTDHFAPRLAPRIAHEIVPVLGWQMATEPLGDNVRRTILPGRQAMSDTHGELYFMRFDRRQRLVTGGALVLPFNTAERLKPYVRARLMRLFPQIGEPRFDYVWNGAIAMTNDFMPRVHRLGPDAFAWAGCNGRGVALAVAMGRELARAVTGTRLDELALPLTEPSTVPFHALVRRVAQPVMLTIYRRRDAKEI